MLTKPNAGRSYWVSNLTQRDIGLSDLRVTIPAYRTVNLLDEKHYHLTIEQLEASAASGSIFKRKGLISVRDVPPPQPIKTVIQAFKGPALRRVERSIIQVEVPVYEELQFSAESDEKFAAENLDVAEEVNQPILTPKK